MNREAQSAWAAGLFEGEGCITTSDGRNDIHLAVAMTDADVLRRFARVVGVGSVWLERRADPPRKPLWRWQTDGEKAEAVLRMLLPYLGERRTARAGVILAKREAWRREATRERHCAYCNALFRPHKAHASARRQRFCSRRCQLRCADAEYRLRTGALARGTAPECRNGHLYTFENTRVTPAGHRVCRTCSARRTRESRLRRLEAAA